MVIVWIVKRKSILGNRLDNKIQNVNYIKTLLSYLVTWALGRADGQPAAYQPNQISKRKTQGPRQNLDHQTLARQWTAGCFHSQDYCKSGKRVQIQGKIQGQGTKFSAQAGI
jgi:hypothetical protein